MKMLASNFRATFAIFVLAGAALIFTVSGVYHLGQSWSTAHSLLVVSIVGLMLIFGAVVWVRSKGEHASEHDAEAFYYLGFIYTLLTLVATFTPLLVEGNKPTTQQVLGMFGLGLVTTFVGLSGRVFFLQARPNDEPEQGFERLSRACAYAARELEETAVQLSQIGVGLEQSVVRSQGVLAASMETATQEMLGNAKRMFDDTNERVEVVTTQTAQKISDLVESTTAGVSGSLRLVQARIEALKLPPAELGNGIQRRIEELSTVIAATTGRADELGASIAGVTRELGEVVASTSLASDGLKGLGAAAHGAVTEVDHNAKALASLRETTEMAERALVSSTRSIESYGAEAEAAGLEIGRVGTVSAGLTASFESMSIAVRNASPGIGQIVPRLSEIGNGLRELVASIKSAEQLGESIAGTHKTLAVVFARNVELLSEHQARVEDLSRELGQDLQASGQAVRKVHDNLISATESLTSRV